MSNPFHVGEQMVQTRAGVREKAEQIGSRMIRSFMPEQHREFFAQLPALLVAAVDSEGQPHASVLCGAAGFAWSPHPALLCVGARPEVDDPIASLLHPRAAVGLLGLEWPTRRRNRMNGRIVESDERGLRVCSRFVRGRAGARFFARQGTRSEVWLFQMNDEKRSLAKKRARPSGLRGKCRHAALRDLTREQPLPTSRALPGDIWRSNAASGETGSDPTVAVAQSFGNCPKYIQARDWQATPRVPGLMLKGDGLDERWLALVTGADTLFIASQSSDSQGGGVDISHRGGPAGFVELGRDGSLWMPDYSGNRLFNTLGNLLRESRSGLLFIDFSSGDLLHLQAHAELVWPEQYAALGITPPPGAERMLALTPGRWTLRRSRLPLGFDAPQISPFLPEAGV
jgi:predicted pyridoxine 5'-phosphate oxidase superfamily flavin-nucleotide-binding protein